jgi:hypothetical protein
MKPINVLIACECSGKVREAFRRRGANAFSCDLKKAEDNSPYHFQEDVFTILREYLQHQNQTLHLVIAFPPCTDICVSGSQYFEEKRMDGRQKAGIEFFMRFANLAIECSNTRYAIENPIGIMSTVWREPNQIIQPWQFGEPESKFTCLWLHGLPPLKPTKILAPLEYWCPTCEKKYSKERRVCTCGRVGVARWSNQSPSGANNLPANKERATIRSRTYDGIAEAMGEQWGDRKRWLPLVRQGFGF